MVFTTTPRPIEDRFWEKVQPATFEECWQWTASLDSKGYAQIRGEGGGLLRGHRLAWELMRGEIPPGLVLDHLCRNRACVNPWHLEPVTHQENLRRQVREPRTHCKRHHEMTEENTAMVASKRYGKSYPTCRTCHNRNSRDAKRRARAAKAGRPYIDNPSKDGED